MPPVRALTRTPLRAVLAGSPCGDGIGLWSACEIVPEFAAGVTLGLTGVAAPRGGGAAVRAWRRVRRRQLLL